jgi:hypothetical protein
VCWYQLEALVGGSGSMKRQEMKELSGSGAGALKGASADAAIDAFIGQGFLLATDSKAPARNQLLTFGPRAIAELRTSISQLMVLPLLMFLLFALSAHRLLIADC